MVGIYYTQALKALQPNSDQALLENYKGYKKSLNQVLKMSSKQRKVVSYEAATPRPTQAQSFATALVDAARVPLSMATFASESSPIETDDRPRFRTVLIVGHLEGSSANDEFGKKNAHRKM